MKKLLAILLAFAMMAGMLTACGGGGETPAGNKDDGVIRVWVGEESAEFYQKICNQYVADHSDFGYTVEVTNCSWRVPVKQANPSY